MRIAAMSMPAVDAVATDRIHRGTDVRRPATCQLADVAFAAGPVHLLCNNAGVVMVGRTWELPIEAWERVLGVDLWGPIHGIREFVPRMLASGEPGHIVNIASMASVLARPGIGPYNVAKHGVLALGETLGRELHEMGAPIGVTTVFPGRVATDLGSGRPTEPIEPDPDLRSPEEVAARVVEAVRLGERFVFTHPGRVDEAVQRMRGVLGTG
jgi:NAD(P)-dependent dehydrogenase (short-subunit alcohol dehydrogenase family)